MRTITIGVDLAKQVFSACELDERGNVVQRRELRRDAFAAWLAQRPPGSVVAMEACGSAHHWARRCVEHGLAPKLMAAQFVTPFRKSRAAKNDRNDAEAIATAARQGNMRFVPVKTLEQQARLAIHRVREGDKAEHLACGNRLRGILAEFGVVIAPSDAALSRTLADVSSLHLPATLMPVLSGLAAHWHAIGERIRVADGAIAARARGDASCRRVQAMTGIGPLTADALVATIGNGRDFRNGRQFAAWLGLTPSQFSTGGLARLGKITRRGDSYLRTLLIQGARSALQRARAVSREKASPEQLWIQSLHARLPFGKVLVAIANKHARQAWVLLAREVDYDSHAALAFPRARKKN
jgi:transposase